MNLETKVKTISGNFRRASEFAESTWQSSAEITKDRITKKSLREEAFYTNNHALYDIEEGNAFLYFGSKDNSIFRKDTIDKAFEQLTSNETGNYYRPSKKDVAKAKQSSLKLRISDLELKFHSKSDVYGYFDVDTSDLTGSKLNETQRKFAEAVYGSMKQDEKGKSDYSRAMQMLNNKGEGIKKAKIYALREETVLKDAKDGAVARACWLYYFDGSSDFYAYAWGVDYLALRGVRSVGKADAREVMSHIQNAYRIIINTPLTQLKAQATPKVIEKMLKLGAIYVNAQKQ